MSTPRRTVRTLSAIGEEPGGAGRVREPGPVSPAAFGPPAPRGEQAEPHSYDAPDLLYSEDEEELRSAVRRLLADHCAAATVLARSESNAPHDRVLWKLLAEDMGLAGLLVPEWLGGQGARYRETAVVLEELGRFVAPVPFLTSPVMATEALLGCLADEADEADLADGAAGGASGAGGAGASGAVGGPSAGGALEAGGGSKPEGGAFEAARDARADGALAGDGALPAGASEGDRGPAAELLAALATGRTVAVLAMPLSTGPGALPTGWGTMSAGPGTESTGRGSPTASAAVSVAVPTASDDVSAVSRAGRPDARHHYRTLHGRITGVADAAAADVLLVPAATGLYAVDVRQDGVTVTARTSLDRTRPLADVTCTGARARVLTVDARGALHRALRAGAGLLASEQLGVADWCLTETVRYTRDRRQFNRSVGSFQALKHRLAQVWLETVHARAAARNAAAALATGSPETALAVALAQACASGVAVHAAEEALQLHGGIGMTWEHPVHLYLKRAKADSIALGTAAHHHEQLTRLAGLTGPGQNVAPG